MAIYYARKSARGGQAFLDGRWETFPYSATTLKRMGYARVRAVPSRRKRRPARRRY